MNHDETLRRASLLADLRDLAGPPKPTPAGPLARPAPKQPKERHASGLKRTKRMKQRNEERRAKTFAEDFGPCSRMARFTRCAVPSCGRAFPHYRLEAAHVVSRGANGKDWANVCGLCAPRHREQTDHGIQTFQKRHNVDLAAVATYVADLVRSHFCTTYPEFMKDGSCRCAVCLKPIDAEKEGLCP